MQTTCYINNSDHPVSLKRQMYSEKEKVLRFGEVVLFVIILRTTL